MTKFSALGIDALAYSGKQQTHFDATVPGFGVRVGKKAKTFVLMVGRERKLHSLGRYPAISLKSARTAAMRLLAEQDTTKHVKPRVKALVAIEAFMTEKQAQSRVETLKIYNRSLKTYLKDIHTKNIEDVTTDDITGVTDRLLKAGKGASANLCLVNAKSFLKWCVKRRLIPHSPVEGLDKPARQTSRERVLSDQELRTIWRAAEQTEGSFSHIIRLLILTGARRLEIGSLKPKWLDLEKQILKLPSEITKNRREHSLPLSALCVGIITPLTKSGTTFLFPAADKTRLFKSWSNGKEDLDKKVSEFVEKDAKLDKLQHWTLHDLRRTYATNLQRLGIKLEVIEALLNHVSGTRAGIVGIYNRHRYEDEMREAVDLYSSWFTKTIISD